MGIWRELRPYVRRSDNHVDLTTDDAAHIISLVNQHHASCDDCTDRANNIRQAKDIPPDNSIETELKDMGLV